MNQNRIIFITGGSFQGKSLIALELARRLRYSGVLTTDTVRNILKILQPEKLYLNTSTYLLSSNELNRQIEEVSEIVRGIIGIYESRGEKMFIEGMHFSLPLFKWIKENNYCRIAFDNQLPVEKRIIKKGITRSRFRMDSDKTLFITTENLNVDSVQTTAFYQHKNRIQTIHENIMNHSKDQGFHIIRFSNIEDAINEAFDYINVWFGK